MTKYIISSLLMLFILSSCEDQFSTTLNVDPPKHTPQMAVHAYLMDNYEAIGISVVRTYGILENSQSYEEQFLEGATVEIYQQGQLKYTVPEIEQDPNLGIYTFPINYGLQLDEPIGGLGDSFEIKVTHPQYGTVTGVQYMPEMAVELSQAKFDKDGGIDEDGGRINAINITFTDQPGVENFYEVLVAYKYEDDLGNVYYDTRYLTSSDPNTADGSNRAILLTDGTFAGKEYTLNLDIYDDYDENLVVIFRTVSKDWYLFSRSLHNFDSEEDFGFFSEPVTVHSNLNGGLGVFCVGTEVEMNLTQ